MKRSACLLFMLLILSLVLPAFSISSVSAVDGSTELWSKTYGGDGKDASTSLVQTSDGGYALAGFTHSTGNGDSDALLIKTDEYGNMEWNKTFSGPDNYDAASLIQTIDGGFAFSGAKGDFESGDWDFWLVKTDEHGYIPEFPSWTILPLILIITLFSVFVKRKLGGCSRKQKMNVLV